MKEPRPCYSHRGSIFAATFSPCGKYIASASQDSTVRIWSTTTQKCLQTLSLDADYECLRVVWYLNEMLFVGSANGMIHVYLDPVGLGSRGFVCTIDAGLKEEIYALQVLSIEDYYGNSSSNNDNNNCNNYYRCIVLAAVCNTVLVYDLALTKQEQVHHELKQIDAMQFEQVSSNDDVYGGEARNPDKLVFIFDVVFCPVNRLMAVALSDGSIRLIDMICRECIGVLTLENVHLTSLEWNSKGDKLLSCTSTGQVVVWKVIIQEQQASSANNSSSSYSYYSEMVLTGGHVQGRPIFGAKILNQDTTLLVTWGADGRVCLWQIPSLATDASDNNNRHLGVLYIQECLSRLVDMPNYPIYSVDVLRVNNGSKQQQQRSHQQEEEEVDNSKPKDNNTAKDEGHALDLRSFITTGIVAGGDTDGGFIGNPMYLYDL